MRPFARKRTAPAAHNASPGLPTWTSVTSLERREVGIEQERSGGAHFVSPGSQKNLLVLAWGAVKILKSPSIERARAK